MSFKLTFLRVLDFLWPSVLLVVIVLLIGIFLNFSDTKLWLTLVLIGNSVPVSFLIVDYVLNDLNMEFKVLNNGEMIFKKSNRKIRFSNGDVLAVIRKHSFLPRLFIIEFYYYQIILNNGEIIEISCLALPYLKINGLETQDKWVLLPMTSL